MFRKIKPFSHFNTYYYNLSLWLRIPECPWVNRKNEICNYCNLLLVKYLNIIHFFTFQIDNDYKRKIWKDTRLITQMKYFLNISSHYLKKISECIYWYSKCCYIHYTNKLNEWFDFLHSVIFYFKILHFEILFHNISW